MKAIVLNPCLISGSPVKAGDAVEVDKNTFANLVRKGWLGEWNEPKADEQIETKKTPKPKK